MGRCMTGSDGGNRQEQAFVDAWLLLRRFPEFGAPLRHLAESNEAFLRMARDYDETSRALAHWRSSQDLRASERVADHGAALRSIEAAARRLLELLERNLCAACHRIGASPCGRDAPNR